MASTTQSNKNHEALFVLFDDETELKSPQIRDERELIAQLLAASGRKKDSYQTEDWSFLDLLWEKKKRLMHPQSHALEV